MLLPQAYSTGVAAVASEPEIQVRRSGRVEDLQAQVERLMKSMRIAVVFAGDKSVEGSVINATSNIRCWKSYQTVAEDIAGALERIGFRHVVVMPEDMQLGERLLRSGTHLAWLNSGGVQGFNPMSHAAAMLEMLGLPYVGHDPLTVGMLDNKHVFKRELVALSIPSARFITKHFGSGPFVPEENRRFNQVFGGYRGPFVVKPVSGRASWQVHLVSDSDDLGGVVADVHEATQNHVLIEEFVPGREFCIAACGPVSAHSGKLVRQSEPFVFAAVERQFEPDEKIFTSMDVRPITPERMRHLDPVRDEAELRQLRSMVRDIFYDLNLESLIRLDLRMDAEGRLLVLEANPKPDLKFPTEQSTSLVCANLEAYGMSYDDLILSLIADRIDLLFSQRRRSVGHLTALLKSA